MNENAADCDLNENTADDDENSSTESVEALTDNTLPLESKKDAKVPHGSRLKYEPAQKSFSLHVQSLLVVVSAEKFPHHLQIKYMLWM